MSDTVLCINAGSSSIKFKLFEAASGTDVEVSIEGQAEGFGVKPRLSARDGSGAGLADERFDAAEIPDADAAMPMLLEWLGEQLDGQMPIAVGHRVVLGGTRYDAPTLIDDEVLGYLNSIVQLAPLHLPGQLTPVAAIRRSLPDVPQVAVFDTSFHRGHAEVLERLPIPGALHEEGVQRYGYHGISYDYIAQRLPEVAPDVADGKVLVAHLGSGCSMCGIENGRSIDSTMSFSALEGLPMGTRPGRLDVGVILYLQQVKGMSLDEVEHMLYRECGLKGISGISNDVRELLASDAPQAKLAIDYFTLACARGAAELAVVMGGLDGIVFTAGVGEHSAPIRAAIAKHLGWLLGVELDDAANAANGPLISSAASRVACYVIPTDEELMIARHALGVVRSG